MRLQRLLASVVVAASVGAASVPAWAESVFVLDFEGLGVTQTIPGRGTGKIEEVRDFYNGGLGGSGSGPGVDYGISFSDNALAIVDADAAGLPEAQGNFGGEPSPDTVLFFLTGAAATMTSETGFTDGFSFYYSSINFDGFIRVFSGPNGTGDLLAELDLPKTQANGDRDPTGQFSPFVPLGVAFEGVAHSVDFGGTINQIGFDNITFGSATPVPGDGGEEPNPNPGVIPTPTAALAGLSLFALGGARRRR